MIKKFVISCILALATLMSVFFFWDNYAVAISLLVFIGFLMILNEGKWDAIFLYAIVFVLGPLAEAAAIYFGAWSYSLPQFIGISAWLPFVWGNAALFIRNMNEFVVNRRR